MRALRRAALAIAIGSLFAALLRLRGSGGSPPRSGGWRELDDEELRKLTSGSDTGSGRGERI